VRVRFPGTAAADGYPNPSCACDNCQQAREAGGKNLRPSSALLVNDDLLSDLAAWDHIESSPSAPPTIPRSPRRFTSSNGKDAAFSMRPTPARSPRRPRRHYVMSNPPRGDLVAA